MQFRYPFILCLIFLAGCSTADQPTRRITELTGGQTAIVKGRAGIREQPYGQEGTPDAKTFSLRDDWGDMIHVRAKMQHYPWMGRTYSVTGKVSKEGNDYYMDTDESGIHPLSPDGGWIAGGIVILIGLIGGAFAVMRSQSKPQPVWGHLVKVSGKEAHDEFPLSGDKVEIGRGPDAKASIGFFQEDHSVSRVQGIILRKGTSVIFENRSSNGTIVNGKKLNALDTVELTPGTTIEMGNQRAVVRYRPLGAHGDGTPADATNYGFPNESVMRERMAQEVNRAEPLPRIPDPPTARTVPSPDRTQVDSDRTVQVPGRAEAPADSTVHMANTSPATSERTVHISEKAPDTADRTVHIPEGNADRTVHIPENAAPMQERTVMAQQQTMIVPDRTVRVPAAEDRTVHQPEPPSEEPSPAESQDDRTQYQAP